METSNPLPPTPSTPSEATTPPTPPSPPKKRSFFKTFFLIVLIGHLLAAAFFWWLITSTEASTKASTEAQRTAMANHEATCIQRIKATPSIDEALPLLRELFDDGDCSPEALTFIRERLRIAAREQHTEAQLLLADTYVCQDAKETLFWWTIAANNTYHPDAQFALGCAYAKGYGNSFNLTRAIELLDRAKAQGHPAAYLTHLTLTTKANPPKIALPKTAHDYFLCGLYAATGHEQAINLNLALQHWTTASALGHTEAPLFLAMHAYHAGDRQRALSLLNDLNERAPTAAIKTLLARIYVEDIATPEAYATAQTLLLQAADENLPPALFLLGYYAQKGFITPPLPPYRYFRIAVEIQPFPAAAYAYGNCLYHGIHGAPESPAKALPWIEMAAHASILPAQWRLAEMYRHGIGTPVDLVKANEWTRRATKADSRPHTITP